jgi:hypothetical protein
VNIHEAIIRVRDDVGIIGKGDRNTQQNFLFRGVDRVLNTVGPAMVRHGVNCYPELQSLDYRDVVTSKGTRMREVTVQVAYHYVGPEGDMQVTIVPGEAMDAGDKAVSKAMSVALRTAHIQTFQIPTGDADPDSQTFTRKVDPVIKLKQDIWAEARKREWIQPGEHGETYDELQADFVTWSEGQGIEEASAELLTKYLTHLRPKRTMKRGDS